TDSRAKEAEKLVFALPEIKGAFMAIGLFDGQPNSGLFFVTLTPRETRPRNQTQIMGILRKELASIPGFQAFPVPNDPLRAGPGTGRATDLQFVLRGPELDQLDRLSSELKRRMAEARIFADIDDDLELTRPQVNVTLDRDAAADLGLNTRDISLAIQVMMGGLNAAKFQVGGDRYDIRVKAFDRFRTRARDLNRIVVRAADGRLVELSNVIHIQEGLGPNQINRYNRQRSVTISANMPGVTAGEGTEKFQELAREVLRDHPLYSLTATGQTKVFKESAAYLQFALVMAILVVYGTLAMQFESFVHPFTVLLTVPLATIGVFVSLLVAGMTLNVYSFIGIIMLSGIVTRNAILLVDRVNQMREAGMDLKSAVLEAGPVRLRPILMTSIAAAVGIFPVALGLSEGGEARAPMGVAVIGGLITSTLLTLFVIPSVYMLLDFLGGRRRAVTPPPAA
ncbi:MAG: efflux RND transporter permease subunit, partial [Candidatus Eremiobacterota bacterium]